MSDGEYAPRPVARWYLAGAIASVLFMLVGCAGYLMTVLVDPATMPVDQRAMLDAQPLWMIAAYAIAVWVGLAGAVMLALRRKLAVRCCWCRWLRVWSLSCRWQSSRGERAGLTNDIAAAVIVLAITWTIFWFARHSQLRGWLR